MFASALLTLEIPWLECRIWLQVLSRKKQYWIKMKTIEVDEELYRYIASHTQHIGESASDILRRMLKFTAGQPLRAAPAASAQSAEQEKIVAASRRAIACVPCVNCCCRMSTPNRAKR
jgi:predicted CopG family antitoxin